MPTQPMSTALRSVLKRSLRPFLKPVLARLEMPARVLSARLDAVDGATSAIGQSIPNIEAAIGRLAAANGVLANRIKDLETERQRSDALIAALRDEVQVVTRSWMQTRIDVRRAEQPGGHTADRR